MSQAKIILEAMRRGEPMTAARAADIAGCYALHSRIDELRKEGHEIDCVTVPREGRRPLYTYRLIEQK